KRPEAQSFSGPLRPGEQVRVVRARQRAAQEPGGLVLSRQVADDGGELECVLAHVGPPRPSSTRTRTRSSASRTRAATSSSLPFASTTAYLSGCSSAIFSYASATFAWKRPSSDSIRSATPSERSRP